ncbi:MAG: hypothetical protein IKG22_12635 [Atopobiaceae bacterium]|nr:hypothetical protein [Atopobiaceae bacterium]
MYRLTVVATIARTKKERHLASLAGGASLFAGAAESKLARLRAELAPLAARYDVMVANPPYMGASNMNKWLNGWTKKHFAESCRDLCTCFIKRGMVLARRGGYEALITSDTCMYISSFEKMRKLIIEETSIIAFIDTRGTNAHPDVFDANAGWVLWNDKSIAMKGSYFKLNQPIAEKEAGLLEALANPDCGWFFRRSNQAYRIIPGSPIAYWASDSLEKIFSACRPFDDTLQCREGIHTANNERFLRLWWEVSNKLMVHGAQNLSDIDRKGRWVPYCKGGPFRKWYGNFEYLIGFNADLRDKMRKQQGCVWPSQSLWFKEGGTWTAISSGCLGVRYYPAGCLFDAGGQVLVGDNCIEAIAALNSSLYNVIAELTMPTLNYKCGVIKTLPDLRRNNTRTIVTASNNVDIACEDWNSSEMSWDFKQHPLI